MSFRRRTTIKTATKQFHIGVGTVQCYIARDTPFYMRHFGRAEYDREKAILTERLREQGQAVCDALNSGKMTLPEAEEALDKIWY